jgi:hypothetical protein
MTYISYEDKGDTVTLLIAKIARYLVAALQQ